MPENGIPLFSATIFLIAGSIGIILSIAFKKTFGLKNDIRTIIAGIILGIVNYSSIYFLLKALDNEKPRKLVNIYNKQCGYCYDNFFNWTFILQRSFI